VTFIRSYFEIGDEIIAFIDSEVATVDYNVSFVSEQEFVDAAFCPFAEDAAMPRELYLAPVDAKTDYVANEYDGNFEANESDEAPDDSAENETIPVHVV